MVRSGVISKKKDLFEEVIMTDNAGVRKLGVIECIAVLVGGMVGAAIFSLSGLTIRDAGPASAISWVIAAVVYLVYGLMAAELSMFYPQSGGLFVFTHEAVGKKESTKDFWGWMTAWTWLNVALFGAAFCAVYVGQYLGIAFPFFKDIVLWAVVWVVVCGVLCLFNISVAGIASLILTVAMIILMLVYAFLGLGNVNVENFKPFFTAGAQGATGWIGAIPIAMMAFNAISAVAFMISQIKKPKKTVPKSMIISMVITIVVYLLVLVATIGMVGAQYFIQNPGTEYVPLYSAAWNVLYAYPWLPAVISIAATLALTTTLLVLLMTAGWTFQSAAASGLLPKFLAKVNPKTGTPVNALLLSTVIVLIFSVLPKFTEYLVNTGGIANALAVIMVAVTLIAARKKKKHEPEDFVLKGGSFLPILIALLVAVFILPGVFVQVNYWLVMLAWLAIGALIFVIEFYVKKSLKH